MATTSLWRVKGYIGKVLLYAENPDKTTNPTALDVPEHANRDSLEDVIAYAGREEATNMRQLVWGINCTPQNARKEMMAVKEQYDKTGGTIAYHGYQSFKEGEVTPEQAHEIGIALAMELWGDRYQVLVATHLDKDSHIHNHFVINTVSWVDGIKFHRTNEDYQRMRDVSDRLCRERGLSVIKKSEGKRKNYSEWAAEQNGKPTNRSLIRADIDRAIAASVTERDFYDLLESWGYEFKFYGKTGELLERPSLKPKGAERFFRFDRLGEDYTVDEICNRILENIREKEPFPEETKRQYHRYRRDNPPRTKAKGLAALYYYYCYELHIIVRYPASVKRVSFLMREDLRKLDRLDEQTRFLGTNGIETLDDLNAYREAAKEQMEALAGERDKLRNKLKRVIRIGDEATILAVKKEIAGVTAQMQKIKANFKICDSVEERSSAIRDEMDTLYRDQERKENSDELFGRRSGTSRENVTQRH